MKLNKFKNIEEVIQTLSVLFLNHNGEIPMRWTPSRRKMFFNLESLFVNRIIELFKDYDEYTFQEIEISPSQYIKTAYNFESASKTTDIDSKIIEKNYIGLCNIAISRRNSMSEKISKKINSIQFNDVISQTEKQEIAYLNSYLRAYCECLYFDDHTIGGDIYGPYKFNNNFLIVREYNRIRPIVLYPWLKDMNIEKITSYCIYEEDIISLDLIGNMTTSSNVVEKLVSYYIEVKYSSGVIENIKINEINKINDLIEKLIIKCVNNFDCMSTYDKKRQMLNIEFYALEPLFKKMNLDWTPSQKEYDTLQIDKIPKRYIEIKSIIKKSNDKQFILENINEILNPNIKWEG